MCVPSCIIPPSDPVILPENVTAETMDHRLQPTRVQVSAEGVPLAGGFTGSVEGSPTPLYLVFFSKKLFASGKEG